MRVMACLLPALALAAPMAAADVLIVDPAGSQGYSQIQAAIDAAQDGDVILVRSGTYAGFALVQRSLLVRGDVNAKVVVAGGVAVADTPAGGVVLLADLEIRGADAPPTFSNLPGGNALALLDNAGFVRVQGCLLRGGMGAVTSGFVSTPGGDGCSMESSPKTALVDCTLNGGLGGGNPFFSSLGGVGGHGLRTRTSGPALYDCTVLGGQGGYANEGVGQTGGPGGPGCEVLDYGIFASNTSFRGGMGGEGWKGGAGGNGLIVQAAAQAQLLSCTLLPGISGHGFGGGNGLSGQASSGGGVLAVLPGTARVFSAPSLAADGSSVSVSVKGLPGDAIWLVPGKSPAHVPALGLFGVWLVERPVFLTKAPLAILGPSGQATVTLPIAAQGAATPWREIFLQGFALATDGQITLGSAAHIGVVDCASVNPDCNGSGAFDTCDVLSGASIDCNTNSIPDECDIASGTSQDLNGNGVPDECEAPGSPGTSTPRRLRAATPRR